MSTLENIISQQVIQKLGWTLIHFLWQGTAAALLLAILLKLLRKSTPNLRYIIACLALGIIALLPVITMQLVLISPNAGHIELPSVKLVTDNIKATTLTEIPLIETSGQAGNVVAAPSISWRQRAIETIEPSLPYMVFGWLAGVFGLSIWHLGGWTQLQTLRRRMVKQVSERVRLRAKCLAEQIGVKRCVNIVESAMVQVPTVLGWLKPVILLPASALTGLNGQQIEAILAHELAHIKRLDYLVNMLQTVVEILGFYHPAVWWVSNKIRVERENCCDDLAVSICSDRVCYARALTTMEEIRAGYGLAVAATGGSLLDRIRRLLGKDYTTKEKTSWMPSVIAILLIMALIIPTALALSSKAKSDLGSIQTNGATTNLVNLISVKPKDITVERLADICEAMESSIGSIHISYEWYNEPPMTVEDIAGSGMLIAKGHPRYELLAVSPFSERVRIYDWTTFVTGSGNSWDGINKSSYNGKFSKHLSIGGFPKSHTDGTICKDKRFVPDSMNLTPLDFSILRSSFDGVVDKKPLSMVLKDYKDLIVLDNTVLKINGFDCMKVDLLQQQIKKPVMRIYFSAEHGYAPVRYEYINGSKVTISVDITSFQQVTDGLWFPSGGIIRATGDKRANVYKAIGNISINESVSDADFDVVFPAGTRVYDEVKGTSYIVEPTKELKEKFDKEQEYIKEHTDEIEAERKEGGTIYSAAKLSRLGTARGLYFVDNNKKFPQRLEDLKSYLDEDTFSWILKNVHYTEMANDSNESVRLSKMAVAYDKTLLEKGQGTNVLYNDSLVSLQTVSELEKLGIKVEKPAVQVEGREKQQKSEDTESSFGPVIEITVNDESVGRDMYIDFDTGKLSTLPKDINATDKKAIIDWMEKVDAKGAVGVGTWGLINLGMTVLPEPNDRWDRITAKDLKEMNAFIILQVLNPGGDSDTPIDKWQFPSTFAFRTRQGGMGILQILGFTENPKGVKIRYKMIEKPDVQIEAEKSAVGDADTQKTSYLTRVYDLQFLLEMEDRASLETDGNVHQKQVEERIEEIVEGIKNNCFPSSWYPNGGKGTIQINGTRSLSE